MKTVPIKWKIFWVLSYLQLILTGGIILLLGYTLVLNRPGTIILLVLACMAVFAVVAANSGLTVHIMHRYFPDQVVPKSIRKGMTVTGIFTGITWLFLLLICIISLLSEIQVRQMRPVYDNEGLIVTLILIADWLLGLYLLIFQLELSAVMKKNSKATMQDLIESIGQK